jgi:transposase
LKGGDILSETYSTARAAQILDISTNTLKRWYKWYESNDYKKPEGLVLPTPVRDNRGTMFFTMAQIQELHKFQLDINTVYRGCMSEFNAVYQWGRKGTAILNRKENKANEQKNNSKA